MNPQTLLVATGAGLAAQLAMGGLRPWVWVRNPWRDKLFPPTASEGPSNHKRFNRGVANRLTSSA